MRTGDKVQVYNMELGSWERGGMVARVERSGKYAISIDGRTLRNVPAERLWRHKQPRKSVKRRRNRRDVAKFVKRTKTEEAPHEEEEEEEALVSTPATTIVPEATATATTAAAPTTCGLFGCTLSRRHRGICAVAIACHRRGEAASRWLPVTVPAPPRRGAGAIEDALRVRPAAREDGQEEEAAAQGQQQQQDDEEEAARSEAWSVEDAMSVEGDHMVSLPLPPTEPSTDGAAHANFAVPPATPAAQGAVAAASTSAERAAAVAAQSVGSGEVAAGGRGSQACETPTTQASASPSPSLEPSSPPQPALASSSPAAAENQNESVVEVEVVADPCTALRAAAASKGLKVEMYTGRKLPEHLASEALALAHRNMHDLEGWDPRQRAADLSHPQTRILVLHRPEPEQPRLSAQTLGADANADAGANANAVMRADGEALALASCGRAGGVPVGRASRSRTSSSRTCAADGRAAPTQGAAASPFECALAACGGMAIGPSSFSSSSSSSVVDFASFRFVTQETLRVVYLFELHLEEPRRRQGLGSALLGAVHGHGTQARKQGLLLTVHTRNENARRFYDACGLEVSPTSPSQCAPPAVAEQAGYDVMQSLWSDEAREIMRKRGAAARALLHKGVADAPPAS